MFEANDPQKLLQEIRQRMQKSVRHTQEVLAKVRTGRASVGLVEGVRVDYYGVPTPLHQLATITVPEPRVLMIQPFDPQILPAIEKALRNSELGLNITIPGGKGGEKGKVIIATVPELSEERRKELVRLVRKEAEEGRVALRNIRRDALEFLKGWEKEKKLGEDGLHRLKNEIQKVTDEHIAQVDELLKLKEEELLKH
jgi:ribosome recycling factor